MNLYSLVLVATLCVSISSFADVSFGKAVLCGTEDDGVIMDIQGQRARGWRLFNGHHSSIGSAEMNEDGVFGFVEDGAYQYWYLSASEKLEITIGGGLVIKTFRCRE